MDVATISFLLTFLGCFVIAFLEYRSMSKKAIEPVTYTYEQRWSNPDYIYMTHKTMELEKANLGEILTECECNFHKPKTTDPRVDTEWDNMPTRYSTLAGTVTAGYISFGSNKPATDLQYEIRDIGEKINKLQHHIAPRIGTTKGYK